MREALITAPHPLTAAQVARRAGLEPHTAGRILSRFFTDGKVSRLKARERSSYFQYYLRPEQADTIAFASDTPGLTVRARFIRELLQRPAFTGHVILTEILRDYEQTIKLRRVCEENQEQTA